MWFAMEPVPLAFAQSSPFHLEVVARVEARPERVFDILATGEGQEEWFHTFVECRWTGDARGVGAEREVVLKRFTAKERFLAWDRGKRLALHIYACTRPVTSAFLEDLTLAPEDGGKATRLTWQVHYKPTLLGRMLHRRVRRIFDRMFHATADGLARYAKAHPE